MLRYWISTMMGPLTGVVSKSRQLTRRYQPYLSRLKVYIPALFFLSGFGWDALTIGQHVARFDLIILAAYLLAASGLIYSMNHPDFILENSLEYWSHQHPKLSWLAMPKLPYFLLQFLFGSMLSALFILYFQSANHLKALVLVFIVGGLLVANEYIENEYKRFALAWALLGLCAMLLFNFSLPFLMGSIDSDWFYISTLLGAGLVVFIYQHMHHHSGSVLPVLLIAGLLMTAYRTDMIPPVPLVKREMTMGYHVKKLGQHYRIVQPEISWWQFWRSSPSTMYYQDGERIYCFSSVFAPSGLKTKLRHVWQLQTPNGWVTNSDIAFRVRGGREQGYRGYSYKQNLRPGLWRVKLQNEVKKTIAIQYFTLEKGHRLRESVERFF